MKNKLKIISLVLVSAIMFSSCSTAAIEKETEETTKTTKRFVSETTLETTEVTEPTVPVEDEFEPFEYEIDYYKVPELTSTFLDPDVIDGAGKVLDAYFNHETTVELDMIFWKVMFIAQLLQTMCPPFRATVNYDPNTNYNESTGVMTLEYYYDEEETQAIIDAFEVEVDRYMSLIGNSDTEGMKALILYYAFSYDATYDYEIFQDFEGLPFREADYRESAYSAVVDHSGICSSFASGLVFLYTQAGIAAEVTDNFSGENGSGAHAWVLAEIDGEYFYIDPTWGIFEGDRYGSVYYFGMTEQDRFEAGGYTSENNTVWYNTVADYVEVDDDRFSDLHTYAFMYVTDFVPNHSEQTIYINAGDDNGLIVVEF